MSHDPRVSTGRGGAGNIGRDDNLYTDGSIVREGIQGVSDDGENLSTGRGGAGNIGGGSISEGGEALENRRESTVVPSQQQLREDDVIPEPAMKIGGYQNFHTGRGGEGNIHKDKYGGHSNSSSQAKAGTTATATATASSSSADTHAHHSSLGSKIRHLFSGKDEAPSREE